MRAQYLDVGDKDEKQAGDDETPSDRTWNRFQRILGFIAKGGRTLEPDQAKDGDHHAEAEARQGDALKGELRRVRGELGFAENDEGQDQYEQDGDSLEHERNYR